MLQLLFCLAAKLRGLLLERGGHEQLGGFPSVIGVKHVLDGYRLEEAVEASHDGPVNLAHHRCRRGLFPAFLQLLALVLQIVVERVENLSDGDFSRVFSKRVSAVLAWTGFDETCIAQPQGELDQVIPRYGHLFRNLTGRTGVALDRQIHGL